MNIQIGVIVTQILGFLVIFLIMRKFAWGPILKLLEERREKIRGSFDDIERQKSEVAGLRTQYEAELKTIEAQARQKMNEALAEAQKMAQDIEASARERSRAELEKLKGDIEREYQSARVRLKEDIVNVALTSAERMVGEKLDRERQKKLVEDFLKELESSASEKKG
jgi:F-type H+-transporting ATPase subunit b